VIIKPFSNLTPEDFERSPIWELMPDTGVEDELQVQIVRELPVGDLSNRIVGVEFLLADGSMQMGFLGNISLDNKRATSHFLTATFRIEGNWFTLSRYFEPDFARNGPKKLAELLGKPEESIFPIKYDISHAARGDEAILRGEIEASPRERLSSGEIARLAVP